MKRFTIPNSRIQYWYKHTRIQHREKCSFLAFGWSSHEGAAGGRSGSTRLVRRFALDEACKQFSAIMEELDLHHFGFFIQLFQPHYKISQNCMQSPKWENMDITRLIDNWLYLEDSDSKHLNQLPCCRILFVRALHVTPVPVFVCNQRRAWEDLNNFKSKSSWKDLLECRLGWTVRLLIGIVESQMWW